MSRTPGRLYNGRPAGTVTAHGGAAVQRHRQGRPTSSRAGSCWTWPARTAWTGCPAATPSPRRTWTPPRNSAGTTVRAGDIVLVRTGQIQALSGRRQAGVRVPVARPVAAHPGVVPRARCRGGRQRHPDLRDLPAGDRGPVAAGARARPGRDGHAPGPELESGGAVHSLCGGRAATRSCCPRCPSRSSAAPAHRSPPWRSSERPRRAAGRDGRRHDGARTARWRCAHARPEHGTRATATRPRLPPWARPGRDPHSSRPRTGIPAPARPRRPLAANR